MNILLLNAGSSSLKATLMDAAVGKVLARGAGDWAGPVTHYRYAGPDGTERAEDVPWRDHTQAVQRFLADLQPGLRGSLAAVGHRVVHGGPFTASVRLSADIRSRITGLAELAPLHNPPSLETLTAAAAELPHVPHVAVFDTSFHATLPPEAHTYPVPRAWTLDWGIRRYGFHGLSHAYCARRALELLPECTQSDAAKLRLVICHLGHGCSAAAVCGGRCIDTTMGFTPLDGLMMATRSGAIDPGILLHVQEKYGLTTAQVEAALNREAGLLGVSGVSSDMRQVLAASQGGHEQAWLALAIYTHRVRQAIGALTVTLGGIDALVFTAGVGEHAGPVRASICSGLECLGLELDAHANATCTPDMDVARPASRGRILVITAREDVTMLQEVLGVLRGS